MHFYAIFHNFYAYINNMTLVQLKHLIELANRGSFSQTAAKLHLTQPALSRSIKALEDDLGHPLFDRVGRKIELTAFGQTIVARARILVDQAQDLKQTSRQLKTGDVGQFRIGMGSGPGAMLMTPLLVRMAQEHPQAHVEISRGNTALLVQALRERMLDALVVDIRSLQPATDLQVEALQEMTGAFMCRPNHPLAKKRQISLAQLRQYPIGSTPLSDEVARILIERFGPEAHPDELVTLRCEEISSLIEVARHTSAVVLTIRAAAPDLVELHTSPALQAKARFGLVTLASRTPAPLLAKVRQLMQEVMKD